MGDDRSVALSCSFLVSAHSGGIIDGCSVTEKVKEAALANVRRTEDCEADSSSYDLAAPIVGQD